MKLRNWGLVLSAFCWQAFTTACLPPGGLGGGPIRSAENVQPIQGGGGDDDSNPGGLPTPQPTVIGGNTLPLGALGAITMDLGQIGGYVYDINTPGQSVYVEFYVDGPAGTGTFLTSVLASNPRAFLPAGPYGFSYMLPFNSPYRDGKIHQLYAYGIDPVSSARSTLAGSPSVFAVGSTAENLAYYNNSVKAGFASACTSCHAGINDYYSLKSMMMSPSKFSGGTANNNLLLNKGLGQAHGGGARCSAASAPCNAFITWWTMEFGS